MIALSSNVDKFFNPSTYMHAMLHPNLSARLGERVYSPPWVLDMLRYLEFEHILPLLESLWCALQDGCYGLLRCLRPLTSPKMAAETGIFFNVEYDIILRVLCFFLWIFCAFTTVMVMVCFSFANSFEVLILLLSEHFRCKSKGIQA